jgi:hypothetical protein
MVNKQRVKYVVLRNIHLLSIKSIYCSYSTFVTYKRRDLSNWCWEPLCMITCSTVETQNSEMIVFPPPLPPPPPPPPIYGGESESDPLWTFAEWGEALNHCEIEVLIPVLLNTHVVWDMRLCGLEPLTHRYSDASQMTWIFTIQISLDWRSMFTKITWLLFIALTICKS